jgi:hypothetical protein
VSASAATVRRGPGTLSGIFFVGFIVFGAVVAAAAVVLGNGNPVMSLAVPLGLGALAAVWKAPLRYSAMGLMFLMWIADYLPEGPQSGLWNSPFYPIGQFLFLNLSALTGIAALRVPGLDVSVLLLLGIGLYRKITKSKIDAKSPSVRTLGMLLLVQFFTVVVLDGWGVSQGGDFNESLWQLRQLLLLPLFTFFFLYALPGDHADLRLIARVAIVAACIKSVIGIYFLHAIAYHSGTIVEFTTSHSDTLLFVPLLAMQIAWFFEKPGKKTTRDALKWVPLVVWGMLANDRRIAYVSLFGCFLCIMLMNPWNSPKRWVLRVLIVTSPLLTAYVAAGWNSLNPVFGGAQLVKSLIKGDQQQAGADYRDIENFDVLFTWSEYPIVPLGFGHKFQEPVKLPDISFAMPTYQFHPHNTILWMWTIGGLFGFFGLFATLVVGVFLAARSYRYSTAPIDRVAALTAISMIIAHLNQCFGDMGTRTYFGSMGCALALAVVSKMAVRVGAWPAAGQTVDLREAR